MRKSERKRRVTRRPDSVASCSFLISWSARCIAGIECIPDNWFSIGFLVFDPRRGSIEASVKPWHEILSLGRYTELGKTFLAVLIPAILVSPQRRCTLQHTGIVYLSLVIFFEMILPFLSWKDIFEGWFIWRTVCVCTCAVCVYASGFDHLSLKMLISKLRFRWFIIPF